MSDNQITPVGRERQGIRLQPHYYGRFQRVVLHRDNLDAVGCEIRRVHHAAALIERNICYMTLNLDNRAERCSGTDSVQAHQQPAQRNAAIYETPHKNLDPFSTRFLEAQMLGRFAAQANWWGATRSNPDLY